MNRPEVGAVVKVEELLEDILNKARAIKQSDAIEPPILKSDIPELLPRLHTIDDISTSADGKKTSYNAVIETAARNLFYDLLASSNIEEPGFARIWNLLDIVSILSDYEECDPGLLFWLAEELLDSQMISGCRKIFDYLESRRERITRKHFKQKNLIILRSCNELLRRLSRAEDTAFCGRVFIFLFQSFPLGDKSSVNLRGEYHVENVTTFDTAVNSDRVVEDQMEIDDEAAGENTSALSGTPNGTKSVSFNAKGAQNAEKPFDPDLLYPIFWSLQKSFSQPKTLFETANFADFKRGLEATISTFKSVQNEHSGRSPAKFSEEGRRGVKRKRGQAEDEELANTFNPKYLTSRELFELEISDLSFRRHILVQSLIIMDFLLSLGSKAKEKLSGLTTLNKAVMYQDQTLNEEDTKWATEMKKTIAEYLKQGFEGPFYHRMVETVLSRDKNWVRWKVEGCPSIERSPISPEEYLSAKAAAKKAATNKRLRPKPMGSLDLGFLTEADGVSGLERLKMPSRYRLPTLESFKNLIAVDDMEIDFPTSDESKEAAIYGKASKSWRALRIASKTKMAMFDKIDNSEDISIIFKDDIVGEGAKDGNERSVEVDGSTTTQVDTRPVVITGCNGVGKRTCVELLCRKRPALLSRVLNHTTRSPMEGEADGIDYNFVSPETFNVMQDGDHFLEHKIVDGFNYGTSRKVAESITASGKIPIVNMDFVGVQQMRDQNWNARVILLQPPSKEILEGRLRASGTNSEEQINDALGAATEDTELYDLVIVNNDLEKTVEVLESFIMSKTVENGVTMEIDTVEEGATVSGTGEQVDIKSADVEAMGTDDGHGRNAVKD